MRNFRVVGFIIAMLTAAWAIMKLFRVASFMLVSVLATLTALWIYDRYKPDHPVIKKAQPVVHAGFSARTRAIQREQIQYGLLAAAQIEILVGEIYASNGEFPNSNKEAGLQHSEEPYSDIPASVSIGTGGVITVRYAAFPEQPDAWLRVVPKMSTKVGPIIWRCESNISGVPEGLPSECEVVR